ncbi:MAG: hypothetical protein GF418_03180 [Chitinivibrionales bacterium]|nr:hypothetical protein [Chitinivibrionales bacterium]MBD3394605.1 hypothetical protein [Chitinivibrionales bacterium]
MTEGTEALRGELGKTLAQLNMLDAFYRRFKSDLPNLPKGRPYDLIVLANMFEDFYACLETGFVRISKFFENNLETLRWHSHLLERMAVDVPGARKRVITDSTYVALLEFLKFRHFKRYYFEFDFDRERIEYLEKRFVKTLPAVRAELEDYLRFLEEISEAGSHLGE